MGDRVASKVVAAALLATSAACLFASMNTAVRALAQLDDPSLSALQIAFFRFFFGLITASPFILAAGRQAWATTAPWAHALRVCVGIGGVVTMFAALELIQVGLATAISFSNPFFALIFAVVFLGERVGIWRWSAVTIGFIGVVMMTGAPAGAIEPAVGLAIIAAIFFGGEVVMIRKLATTEKFSTILLYNNLGALLLLSIPLFLVWRQPSDTQWLLLAAAGASAVLGQMLFLSAMRIGEASFVAPFLYLTLVFAMVFGFVIFDETPTETTLIGSVIITAAGLFMLYREQVSRRKAQTDA